jgi:malate dehydrogenase (oxaloacetate-decarboxylating)(NADP+)
MNDPSGAAVVRGLCGDEMEFYLMIDGEMQVETAAIGAVRREHYPFSELQGDANVYIFPNLDAANIAYNLLKVAAGNGVAIGPILLGCARPVHILTSTATVRRLVNMAALAVVESLER